MGLHIFSSKLGGHVDIPSSKSHTLRAILFASLACGESHIKNPLYSGDTQSMITACRQFGAVITVTKKLITILGVSGNPRAPLHEIDAGNSGQVLRYIAAVCATINATTTITGDNSICSSRQIQPYIAGFDQLGASCISLYNNSFAPIEVSGVFSSGTIFVNGMDSQIVTGLLIALSQVEGTTNIMVASPGETPWIDLTLNWLAKLQIEYSNTNYTHYTVTGKKVIQAFDYDVPGDLSSISFPLVASIITRSSITIGNCDLSDVQGDKAIIPILQAMGADISYNDTTKILSSRPCSSICGGVWNINHCIDAVCILAVMACFATSPVELTGASVARHKESDRLLCICLELRKMGATIDVTADGLKIQPSILRGGSVCSHNDHRIAMSLIVAALASSGDSVIDNVKCIDKSYYSFISHMESLGARFGAGL